MVKLEQISINGWRREAKGLSDIGKEAFSATSRIYPDVVVTRLHQAPWLAGDSNCHVLLKMESEQVTKSFKLRGATNKAGRQHLPSPCPQALASFNVAALVTLIRSQVASLPVDVSRVVTCSSGNHALAVLHACRLSSKSPQRQPVIYLPTTVSARKRKTLEDAGATLVLFGNDIVDTERKARQVAAEQGVPYISPYNDLQISGGQGTIACELLAQLQPQTLDAVFVPVGGGGLISGIASVLAAYTPKVKVVGCQPENSCVMADSVRAGSIMTSSSSPTLSEGTAGGVEMDSITFEPCAKLVNEWITVSEKEIASAMIGTSNESCGPVEGAAAMAMACFIKERRKYAGMRVVIICCGANTGKEAMANAMQILDQTTSREGH